MKKFLLLLMLLCSIGASAQDVIVKRDGSTIVCRVVEVNKTVITYKKWSNLKGPNYVVEKAEVVSVNYENGEKDVFEEKDTTTPAPTPIPTPTQVTTFTPLVQGNIGQQTVSDDMLLRMATKPELTPLQKKVKKLRMTGWICGGAMIAGGLAITIAGGTWGLDGDEGTQMFYPGLSSMVAGATVASVCFIRKSRNKHHSCPFNQPQYSNRTSNSRTAHRCRPASIC